MKTLCKSVTINPFSQAKLMTINNSHVIPDVALNILKKMEEVGEKQFTDFLNDRLIYQIDYVRLSQRKIFAFGTPLK